MERLTTRHEFMGSPWITFDNIEYCKHDHCYRALEKLAHYEDLEEQGRLIELPCKEEDTVYSVVMYWLPKKFRPYSTELKQYEIIQRKFTLLDVGVFGESVFLTKEEAEAKLKELKGGRTDE